jgi:DNA polymerase III epsilon subunit-like protein
MQKYNKLDENVLALLQSALDSDNSVRKAAREVLGKESRESSIRSAIKRGVLVRKTPPSPQLPKMLTIDIETAPILANVWGLFQQNVGLNMIHQDWYVLSYCAKWAGPDGDIYYEDKRESFDTEDDSDLLKGIWKLLDEADIVTGQNSVRFDTKKLNARFLLNGMPPPSSYRQIDTLQMAKKSFGFTSNKLEYLTDKLCKKYKKLKHGKYAGFELWKQCLAGNMDAWNEMEEYNIHDVLSTEELYTILRPWTKNHLNLNVYNESEEVVCSCGHTEWEHSGYHYTNAAKFDKFKCTSCGAENRGKVNLLPKSKRDSLRSNLT